MEQKCKRQSVAACEDLCTESKKCRSAAVRAHVRPACDAAHFQPACSPMTTCHGSATAYSKVLLHAAKFPSQSVTGLLLGTREEGIVRVSDAVPLFHNSISAPVLEAAAALVRVGAAMSTAVQQSDLPPPRAQTEMHAAQGALVVVGAYHAPQLMSEGVAVPPLVAQIATKVHAVSGAAVVWMVRAYGAVCAGAHFAHAANSARSCPTLRWRIPPTPPSRCAAHRVLSLLARPRLTAPMRL